MAWLELMNERRAKEGIGAVKLEEFELLMDRLEKECYFQVNSNFQPFWDPKNHQLGLTQS